jgi:endonuclease/exonuclease/phosphatase family metal-dependent hydrolase
VKLLGLGALIFAAACGEKDATSPNLSTATQPGVGQVTVMTRNMYVGANHDALKAALLNADASDDVTAIATAYRTLKQTDYDLRVAMVVNEIARKRPAVVGLQEVSKIDIDLMSIEDVPMSIHGDFMEELQAAITARELPYVVASKVQNWVAAPFAGARLVDFDVILVDPTQVQVTATFSHNFTHTLGTTPGIQQFRGWTGIEAQYLGERFAFVTTQLEEGAEFAHLRAEQAAELMRGMVERPRVILLADLNDLPGSAAYRRIGETSFRDAWSDIRPSEAGYTGTMQPDLANERPHLTQRVDFVFAKGMAMPDRGLVGDMWLTGIDRSDRFQGPDHMIWPSDHAGVVARLRFPVENPQN